MFATQVGYIVLQNSPDVTFTFKTTNQKDLGKYLISTFVYLPSPIPCFKLYWQSAVNKDPVGLRVGSFWLFPEKLWDRDEQTHLHPVTLVFSN